MAQKPILFSTEMVKAILEGRKTQTRRTSRLEAVNSRASDWAKPVLDASGKWVFTAEQGQAQQVRIICPYGKPGDFLYVRESFAINGTDVFRGAEGEILEETPRYVFKGQKQPHIERLFKWKPSIHMPKEAARIWLEITNVRVERLNDISENDAKAEGIEKSREFHETYRNYVIKEWTLPSAQQSFFSLWESINGIESWKANHWVWVIEFQRIEKP